MCTKRSLTVRNPSSSLEANKNKTILNHTWLCEIIAMCDGIIFAPTHSVVETTQHRVSRISICKIMNNNRLVEIPVADWAKLRDLYSNRKTESASYNMIQNFINWMEADPTLNVIQFFSLNGDWSDGTFVLIEGERYIFFNTQGDTNERLLSALKCIDVAPYRCYAAYHQRFHSFLESYITGIGFNIDSGRLVSTVWYHIRRDEALKFNIDPPTGITLDSLRHEDVDTINDLWPFRSPGSEIFVSRLIAFNPSVGAYDESGNLLSWCLQLAIGSLGILHVKADQMRKGYGSLMVRVMSKKLAEMGIEVTAPVVINNTPSRALFEKLGFKVIDEVHWFHKPQFE